MNTREKFPSRLTSKSEKAQLIYKSLNKLPFITPTRKYGVTISDSHKFIWYRVAKVGTRTIYNALKNNEIELSVEHAYNVYVPTGHFVGYFKFAFVRNPFDRLVSCWLNKVVARKNKKAFDVDEEAWAKMQLFSGFVDYVKTLNIESCNEHIRSQSSLIDLSVVDYIGRMESFSSDVQEVFKRIGVDIESLESRNVTKVRAPYQDYYNAEDVEQVYKIYKKDCQIFGYKF